MESPDSNESVRAPRRVIAIVGRPNVGKSALFNRVIGRRMAIVHEESGVTRDRLAAEATWNDKRFELIDTGGLALMDNATAAGRIEEGVRDQVRVAVEDAAVVIQVVDIRTGPVPLDKEVSRILHAAGTPTLVAANKADHDGLDRDAAGFVDLGFPVTPVSALHSRGVGDLLAAAVTQLPEAEDRPETNPLKIAVVGRPNVGKSSYINRLLNHDRVIVSDVPGTTRDSIEVPFALGKGKQARHYLLIDTAGMRRLGKVDTVVERFSLFRAERSIEKADVVILMLDASAGPTSQDKKIAHKIFTSNRGCVAMINKWDLAMDAGVTQRKYGAALHDELPFMGFVPTVFVSAESGYNIRRSIDVIDHVAAQVRTQLTTGVLNRVLHDAFDRVQPPLVKGSRLKFYYATQTGIQPPRISLFVNNARKVRANYRSYLVNALRQAFGFEGAPVVLRFRTSHDRASHR